ncbi:uncharacterized protein LOC130723514 isoform X2 [Lotus japonicus]|uniref:uncharacterized protein LOC130723514 isoform X2 n=1 Tax=Lotus japonicus TaxID=34305 RepID=UPI00258A6D68|nr:uncharacterized protein LOC130723514 isoform X2 [Lotus japonicus]
MTSSVSIDSVLALCPPNHNWRIKVRVVRLWIADSYTGDNKPVSMELILVDQYGGKIQASIRKILFRKWAEVIVEGNIIIPRWGFTLKDSEAVNGDVVQPEYLVDVLGLLTAASELRTYIKDGISTRMLLIEISDEKGKVECALFGDYADIVSDFIAANANEKPVIVFQLAKIKTFRGKNVLQNVMKASRVIFNPEIAEVISFMDRYTIFMWFSGLY